MITYRNSCMDLYRRQTIHDGFNRQLYQVILRKLKIERKNNWLGYGLPVFWILSFSEWTKCSFLLPRLAVLTKVVQHLSALAPVIHKMDAYSPPRSKMTFRSLAEMSLKNLPYLSLVIHTHYVTILFYPLHFDVMEYWSLVSSDRSTYKDGKKQQWKGGCHMQPEQTNT